MAKAPTANGTNGIEPTGAIHLTLQGKGGVGKSLVASVLAQYLRERGKEVRCIDTDPVNRTFAQYSALGADRLNLRDEHNRIEQRAFDSLIERFLTEDAAGEAGLELVELGQGAGGVPGRSPEKGIYAGGNAAGAPGHDDLGIELPERRAESQASDQVAAGRRQVHDDPVRRQRVGDRAEGVGTVEGDHALGRDLGCA